MTLDDYFAFGVTVELGFHTLTVEEIKDFARKYDPQPFHVDEEEAKGSVFGGLCASGWHTAALWMRHNLLYRKAWTGDGPAPEYGPSPGFKNLRWLKPAYAGETLRFTRITTGLKPLRSRPGWSILNGVGEAYDSTGTKIFSFENAVLVKIG